MKFKSKNHELHYRLWDWLAKHPDKYKQEWPEWKTRGGKVGIVASYCFACEEDGSNMCKKCPIDWTGKAWPFNDCNDCDSVFDWWVHERNPIDRMIYAMEIRDMKWEVK